MINQMGILARFLTQTSQRQGVIASNIANVDTPGYKAKDASFTAELNDAARLAVTNPRHIASEGAPSAKAEVQTTESEPWLDGNTVELDQEVAKMTENSLAYQAGVSLLSVKVRMFKNGLRTR